MKCLEITFSNLLLADLDIISLFVKEFLDTHTKSDGAEAGTARDSKTAPFHWRNTVRHHFNKYVWEKNVYIYNHFGNNISN